MLVDEVMDWPVKFFGKGHRRYLHDPLSMMILFGNDPIKLQDAALHKLVDTAFTNNPKARRILEAMIKHRQ